MKGKEYLDDYVLVSDPNKFSVIQDQANWHRRVAYCAKYAGEEDLRQKSLQKALDLHNQLVDQDPSISSVTQEINEEQSE